MVLRKVMWVVVGVLCGSLLGCRASSTGVHTEANVGESQEVTILDATSFWRCHFTWRRPVVRTGKGLEEVPALSRSRLVRCKTLLPSASWYQVDFDDSSWCRAPGPFFGNSQAGGFTVREGTSPAMELLCLRGKFAVRQPARRGGLKLSVEYRGGIVVYINGKELLRMHLPAGEIGLETPADDYPAEAYVSSEGKGIRWGWGDPEKYRDRVVLRTRRLTEVPVPSSMLRKGMNVVALEVHRAPYHQAGLVKDRTGKLRFDSKYCWCTVGVLSAHLKAPGAGEAIPNIDRPRGFQLWNSNALAGVFDLDYGDPNEPLGAIELVGTRNGACSGQVIVGCDRPIRKLAVKVSDLRLVGGKDKVSASAIQLRCALPGGSEDNSPVRYYGIREVSRFDGLTLVFPEVVPVCIKELPRGTKRSPTFGAVQPVWVTVKVPSDATPGRYKGTLTISAEGMKRVKVPVRLEVAGWRLPDANDFQTFVDLVQSPTSLALQYGVSLWSDEHFELIARSFEHLSLLGSKAVYIPLICHTNFGNAESMVRWITQPDGIYKYDFSIMERYLDIATKAMGKPRIVCLYLWDLYTGGGHYFTTKIKDRQLPHWQTVLVSCLDPVTGKVELLEGPSYEKPAESEAFWRPVLEQVSDRLSSRGLLDAMMLGVGGDVRPGADTVALLHRILPKAEWVMHQHGEGDKLHGVPVGYLATVWRAHAPVDPDIERRYGWKAPYLKTQFPRELWLRRPLILNRLVGEWNLTGGQRGFGRIGADFWPVLKGERGKPRRLSSRYLLSNWHQLSISTSWLAPGADGPLSTVRLEMAREGIQECEARIFLEHVLTDQARQARLEGKLAERAQRLLDERTRFILWSGLAPTVSSLWYPCSGWQQRSRELYLVAAEVADALNQAQSAAP